MKWMHAIQQRILHLTKAKERHGVHSPLIYQLMERDLKIALPPEINIIQDHRHQLLNDASQWEAQDFGAGSRFSKTKTLSTAVQRASSDSKKGAFLYRWVKRFQPHKIIELGTHVGIGTAYLQLGNPSAQITTLEGDPFLADLARLFFTQQQWKIKTILGNFDDTLSQQLNALTTFDLAVIDGNHKGEATLQYIKTIIPFASDNAWILIDDIHWSKDMSGAWGAIVNDPRYQLTLDFYQYGAIYLGKRNQKEHFILKW